VTFIASQCNTKSREAQLVVLLQACRLGTALRGSRSGIRNGFRPAGVESAKRVWFKREFFMG
jgi:hypothetical protein